jgi:hypothetical protein
MPRPMLEQEELLEDIPVVLPPPLFIVMNILDRQFLLVGCGQERDSVQEMLPIPIIITIISSQDPFLVLVRVPLQMLLRVLLIMVNGMHNS